MTNFLHDDPCCGCGVVLLTEKAEGSACLCGDCLDDSELAAKAIIKARGVGYAHELSAALREVRNRPTEP